jgi:hypothetical protein
MFTFKVNKLINKAKAEGFFPAFSVSLSHNIPHSQNPTSEKSTQPDAPIHKKFTLSSRPLPTPPAKNKENSPPSQNPNRNRKNDESGFFVRAHDPLNRSGLFSYQIVRLNKFD